MKTVSTTIYIQASPMTVWEVLTDFSKYPDWNPFITKIDGPLQEGEKIEISVRAPGAEEITTRPKVMIMAPSRELRWKEKLGIPGLLDGEHSFSIRPVGDDQVRFTHEEKFSGVLTPLAGWDLLERTRLGFERMNKALKSRAEREEVH